MYSAKSIREAIDQSRETKDTVLVSARKTTPDELVDWLCEELGEKIEWESSGNHRKGVVKVWFNRSRSEFPANLKIETTN